MQYTQIEGMAQRVFFFNEWTCSSSACNTTTSLTEPGATLFFFCSTSASILKMTSDLPENIQQGILRILVTSAHDLPGGPDLVRRLRGDLGFD